MNQSSQNTPNHGLCILILSVAAAAAVSASAAAGGGRGRLEKAKSFDGAQNLSGACPEPSSEGGKAKIEELQPRKSLVMMPLAGEEMVMEQCL